MSSELIFLLDRSGSMSSLRNRTISDFNEMLNTSKATVKDGHITLVQFDHAYELNYARLPLGHAAPLTTETYQPRGWTALYDAICKTIDDMGKRFSELSPQEKGDFKVVMAIFTDGQENSSKEFDAEAVRKRITHQNQVYNWQFVYMGANQDAILSAKTMGMNPLHAVTMSNNDYGRRYVNTSFADKFAAYAVSGAACALNFDVTDRQEALK